ncbi:MAG: Tex-like N-terminal domain-containing protein, partial [Candidatus Omnitrophica bacterium]|nr:Tex-like N-terminal domain-containing protein [Candidatus Omnitrophota bacterium]
MITGQIARSGPARRGAMFKASKEAIYRYIVEDLSLDINSVAGAIELFLGGATVPFVARYRKERTGGLNETQLRNIQEKMLYYAELEKRKETVLESINIQGRLTDSIRKKVIECREKHALEDLYLPFKPKRQTKASIAVEKGLSALAETIIRQMPCSSGKMDILESFVDTDKGVNSASEALSGALDIVTEAVVDDPSLRGWLRERMAREGLIATRVLDDWKGKKTKYEMYYNFREPLKDAAAHRLLAVRRGANERIISWNIEYDRTITSGHFEGVYVKDPSHPFAEELKSALRKALIRMSVSIEFEMFDKRLEQAEEEAIKVFSKNLENLLLEPPAGHRVIMGVDPGFVTGCKIAVIDDTGKFIKNTTVFPNAPQRERSLAARAMLPMIRE